MKFIVDEMPKIKSKCPFSEWIPYSPIMEETGHYICKINHNDCNLCETECQSLKREFTEADEVKMKEYYDWDEGCYEKVIHSNELEQNLHEQDEKGWRYSAQKSRYSEEIKDELLSLMIKYLENHEIFRLLELVVSAVATKEQEGK